MEIRVLGCHGSQLPGSNTTSFLLNGKILVDGGTITSVLTAEEQQNIECILVTHVHLDHIREIMFLADNLCFIKRERPLIVIGTLCVIEALQCHIFNNIVWPDFSNIPNPENPLLRFMIIQPGKLFSIAGVKVKAIEVNHAVNAVGYVIEAQGQAVIFSGDTGPTEKIWQVAKAKRKELRAIFIETSMPNDMQLLADKTGHLTPRSLKGEIKKMGDLKVPIYLYHLKRQWLELIKEEVDLLMKNNIHVLMDGQIIRIGGL